jgi:two-component system response regulator FixJ
MNKQVTVYIVDDDEAVRKGVTCLVKDMGINFEAYSSAEEFLASYNSTGPECLVLDVRMSGMSGMELLTKLSEKGMHIPTILVTGHGDIPMAVDALKKGAVDFIEKPFREQHLWEKIKKSIELSRESNHTHLNRSKLLGKLSLLADKERQVLKSLLASKTDKQIAIEMDFSRRTAAHHRAKILEKLDTISLIELAKLFTKFDISI